MSDECEERKLIETSTVQNQVQKDIVATVPDKTSTLLSRCRVSYKRTCQIREMLPGFWECDGTVVKLALQLLPHASTQLKQICVPSIVIRNVIMIFQ